MPKPNKILLTFFLLAFVFVLFCPKTALAEAPTAEAAKPVLRVAIGGKILTFGALQTCQGDDGEEYWCIGWIGDYISVLYKYGVGLAAVLAVVMIMVGGFIWLTSAGSPNKVGKAKEFITAALTGLVLALFSFTILYTINPRLVAMEGLRVRKITEVEMAALEGRKVCCVIVTSQADPQAGGVTSTHVDCVDITVEECKSRGGGSRGSNCWTIERCPQYKQMSEDEAEIRGALALDGVGVWESQPGATVVSGLPETSLFYMTNVAEELGGTRDNPAFTVTGGTEAGYHSSRHGPGKNTFDIDRPNSALDNYVSENTVASQNLSWGQASYLDVIVNNKPITAMWVNEGNHYHVELHERGYPDK